MPTLLDIIQSEVQAAFASEGFDPALGKVNVSDRPDLAPFQCNGAMAAAGALKKQGDKANPRDIAAKIAEHLTQSRNIEDVDIAGPGFLNIRPTQDLITAQARAVAGDARTGAGLSADPLKIVIDYGGANVAKPMHVGHLRSAVIGESLKRILRYQGHTVIGDVHLGDWGLQMGHLITELADEQPNLPYFDEDFTGDYPAQSPVTMDDLARLYPQASNKAKSDENRLKRSRKATAELQEGRRGYQALLKHFIAVSVAALKQGYGALGVEFDLWKGEASVDPLIPQMIDDLKSRGIAERDDGALIVPVEVDADKKTVPPVILVSSHGAVQYHTTDLATLVDRKSEIDPDLILYVVDKRQSLHFEQVFRAAVKAGWYTPDQMEHLGFGTMNGKDGTPFKTRAGGVLRLDDLLEMTFKAAQDRLNDSGIGEDFDAEERTDIAQKVGLAALKFADLQNQRLTDYVFDLDRFTSFEGKTGPYLLYAAVRIKSLLRKATELGIAPGEITLGHPSETALVLTLDGFQRAIDGASDKRAPHILCDHAFTLAQAFSKFYTDCPIFVDATPEPQKRSRLALAETTLRQLEQTLDLLGIATPDRM